MTAPDRRSRGRRRGPAPMIGRDDVVDAALRLGLHDVTMREVAEDLGVSIQALYHYVRTRDDLLAAAASRLVDRVVLPEPADRSWAEWLLAMVEGMWTALDEHPGVAAVALLSTRNGAGMGLARQGMAVLHGHYGLGVDIAAPTLANTALLVFAHHAHHEAMRDLRPPADSPFAGQVPPDATAWLRFALTALYDGIALQAAPSSEEPRRR